VGKCSLSEDIKYEYSSSITTELDFIGAIKLANYVRAEAQKGNHKPDISSKSVFEDDKFMQPVLEDDALLFSLDDVLGGQSDEAAQASDMPIGSSKDQVTELEQELAKLRFQFSEYRSAVEKTLDERWTEPTEEEASKKKDENHQDPGYFDSYSYNGEFLLF
jgi:protein arginine N-methyltransferase 3